MQQVITSKKLLERLPLEVPGQTIFLEDIKDTISTTDWLTAILLALLCPVRLLERMLGSERRSPDDVATIIFSSGSEDDSTASDSSACSDWED